AAAKIDHPVRRLRRFLARPQGVLIGIDEDRVRGRLDPGELRQCRLVEERQRRCSGARQDGKPAETPPRKTTVQKIFSLLWAEDHDVISFSILTGHTNM